METSHSTGKHAGCWDLRACPGGSRLASDLERGETESDAARNATGMTQPGVGVPAALHAAELSHVVNYVANSVLKNQFYLQNRPQKKN